MIVHNPYLGWRDIDQRIWNSLENLKLKKCSVPENITLVTWNNKEKISMLEEQLSSLNIKFHNLGAQFKYWHTNRNKPMSLSNYEIKTEYVMGLDSFDVKIVNDLSTIIDKFKTRDCKVLFGATTTVYPKCQVCENESRLIEGTSPFCYLNSGTFIGKTDFVKILFSKLNYKCKKFPESDQYLIRKEYSKDNKNIKIDSNCLVFQISGALGCNIHDYVRVKSKKLII